MKFSGEIRIPEVDHPGVPATFLVEDDYAEVVLEGESLGRWSLYDVRARRLVSSAFQIDLSGEEITFLADDPIDFAYRGVEEMAQSWARFKNMNAARRALAVKRSRKGTQESKIPEVREAMLQNLAIQEKRGGFLTDFRARATDVTPRSVTEEIEALPGSDAMGEVAKTEAEPRAVEKPHGEIPVVGETTGDVVRDAGEDEAETERVRARNDEEQRLASERAAIEAERARLEEEKLALEEAARQAEQREADRVEAYRLEMQRIQVERDNQQRLEEEQRAAVAAEMERLKAEGEEAARLREQRDELERMERERIGREKAEASRLAEQRAELERLQEATAESARVEHEQLEAKRAQLAQLEQERIQREKEETERLEQTRLEIERREAEAASKADQARIEAERLESERLEQERLAASSAEAAGIEVARLEQERLASEHEAAVAVGETEAKTKTEAAAPKRAARKTQAQASDDSAEAAKAEAAADEAAKTEAAKKAADTPEIVKELLSTSAVSEDDPETSKQLVVDLGEFEDADSPDETPQGEPALSGAPKKSGIMGAVKGAFTRGGKNHEHQFVEAPGGIGIARSICEDCGYVSIGVTD